MKLTVTTDRRLIPATGDVRYVQAVLIAPEAPRRPGRTPINVALVLDRSGSMGGSKIELARKAVERALHMLHADDRFTLVVYDDVVDVLMESTLCSAEARQEALRRLALVEARGSTDLSSGWLTGCEQIARFLEAGSLGRCLLVTDGLANRGIIDHDELVQHARALRERGVVTSTFGVGTDFDERLLQRMADAGAGHFYFIERAVQIPDLLASEIGEALEVVARGVTVEAEAPAGGRIELLNPWPTEANPRGVVVSLGEVVSSQEISLIFEVTLPAWADSVAIPAGFRVHDEHGAVAGASALQDWTFASQNAVESQPRNGAIEESVARIYAARARDRALEANRARDFDRAKQIVEETAQRLLSYAEGNPAVRAIAEGLRAELAEFSAAMEAVSSKAMHMRSYSEMRSRDFRGTAVKRPH
jgi:Ca-activated chloride channel family protein